MVILPFKTTRDSDANPDHSMRGWVVFGGGGTRPGASIYIDAQPCATCPTTNPCWRQCLCLAPTPEQQNSTDNRSRVQAQQQEYSAPQLIRMKMMAARPAISPHCGTYSLVILASYPNIVQEQIVMPPLRPPALRCPLQRHPPQTRGP